MFAAPNQCHFCGRRFKTASGLGSHLRVHRGNEFPVLPVAPAAGVRELDQQGIDYVDLIRRGQPREEYDEEDFVQIPDQEVDLEEQNDWMLRYDSSRRRHYIPRRSLASTRYLDYDTTGPQARLKMLPDHVLHGAELINELNLSRANFEAVQDYVKFFLDKSGVSEDDTPSLLKKQSIQYQVDQAINRREDGTYRVKSFVFPPGIPWIEPQVVQFQVLKYIFFIFMCLVLIKILVGTNLKIFYTVLVS